jgi:hypothetical protein
MATIRHRHKIDTMRTLQEHSYGSLRCSPDVPKSYKLGATKMTRNNQIKVVSCLDTATFLK